MYGAVEIPMSIDEYHRLPQKLGWRYDYEGGRAIVAPADIFVDVLKSVAAPLDVGPIGSLRLCGIEAGQAFALEKLYFDAFRPSAETSGLSDAEVRTDATMSMILHAIGAFREPMTCSRVLVDGDEPIAAILVVDARAGPLIHLAMVHPRYQRRGLGTALLGETCAALALEGHSEIRSRYLLANEPSRRWYRKTGFTERPDGAALRHIRHFYHYERSRLEGSGSGEMRAVERELRHWERFGART